MQRQFFETFPGAGQHQWKVFPISRLVTRFLLLLAYVNAMFAVSVPDFLGLGREPFSTVGTPPFPGDWMPSG